MNYDGLLFCFQRVFTPTIPPRRVKRDSKHGEDSATASEMDMKPYNRRGSSSQDKERDNKQRRKKEKRAVIASASVFSMGPAERTMQRRKGRESM